MDKEKIYNNYSIDNEFNNIVLKPGWNFSINPYIYKKEYNANKTLLEELFNTVSDEEVYKLHEQALQEEKETLDPINECILNWKKAAACTNFYSSAIDYLKYCKKVDELETTNNEWIEKKDSNSFHYMFYEISNKTYQMCINIYEDTHSQKLSTYEVSYHVSTRTIANNLNRNTVVNIYKKKFKNIESAMKYIEGRKKAYSKYFKELYNPILEEKSIKSFMYEGILLRGYKLDESLIDNNII